MLSTHMSTDLEETIIALMKLCVEGEIQDDGYEAVGKKTRTSSKANYKTTPSFFIFLKKDMFGICRFGVVSDGKIYKLKKDKCITNGRVEGHFNQVKSHCIESNVKIRKLLMKLGRFIQLLKETYEFHCAEIEINIPKERCASKHRRLI